MSAREAVVSTILVFVIALMGIAILGSLPPVEGPLAQEGEQFRANMADTIVLAATLFGGVSLFILAKLRSLP